MFCDIEILLSWRNICFFESFLKDGWFFFGLKKNLIRIFLATAAEGVILEEEDYILSFIILMNYYV